MPLREVILMRFCTEWGDILNMAHINVQHLKHTFGDRLLFDDISFSVERGERIGLVGPNGAGKSTLLRLIAGQMTDVDGGQVRVDTRGGVTLMEQERTETSTLSGGEKTRAALKNVLTAGSALLLLDEPTNHLDMEGVQGLIKHLRGVDSTLVIVSHDRYFLDETVDRILEVEKGKVTEYWGGYTDYREQKERNFTEAMHRWEEGVKKQKALEEDIAMMRARSEKAHRLSTVTEDGRAARGAKEFKRAKAKKMDNKVKNDIKRLERMMEDNEPRPTKERRVRFTIEGQANSGKRVCEVKGLSKHFGERLLFEGGEFVLCRGDRVALIGANGTGKTTLINMLLGREPYEGEMWLSPSAKPYLIEQDFAELDGRESVLDYLHGQLGTVNGDMRTQLHNLGLTDRHMRQRVCSLSYGERMKLKLAVPILRQEDFLILDEPTNHLDLPTRERLEETLSTYNGTLLVVSHDAYLLRRLCESVLVIREEKLEHLAMSYAEYFDGRE